MTLNHVSGVFATAGHLLRNIQKEAEQTRLQRQVHRIEKSIKSTMQTVSKSRVSISSLHLSKEGHKLEKILTLLHFSYAS